MSRNSEQQPQRPENKETRTETLGILNVSNIPRLLAAQDPPISEPERLHLEMAWHANDTNTPVTARINQIDFTYTPKGENLVEIAVSKTFVVPKLVSNQEQYTQAADAIYTQYVNEQQQNSNEVLKPELWYLNIYLQEILEQTQKMFVKLQGLTSK